MPYELSSTYSLLKRGYIGVKGYEECVKKRIVGKLVERFKINDIELIIISQRSFITDYALSSSDNFIFLDDRIFNNRHLSAEEMLLRNRGAYYFNYREGFFYDQFEVFQGNKRTIFSKPFIIEVKSILLEQEFFETIPFHSRALRSKGLYGDLLSKTESLKHCFKKLETFFLTRARVER